MAGARTPKKGAAAGSGGKNRDALKGRGRTLPADERPWHKGYSGAEDVPQRTAWKQDKERRAAAAEGRAPKIGQPGTKDTTWGTGTQAGEGRRRLAAPAAPVAAGGRRAGRPAGRARAAGRSAPRRTRPSCWSAATRWSRRCARASRPPRSTSRSASTSTSGSPRSSAPPTDRGIALLEISRAELDRMTGGVLHQGIGLQVPPFAYEPFDDLLADALEQPAPLLVALDGVTDPRNLGAVVRSAAAFGAQGVFLPERRAAGHDRDRVADQRRRGGPAADRPGDQPDPGAEGAARRTGFTVVGLDADGATSIYDLEAAVGPLVVVVGSEGRGLSRLVGETCDLRVASRCRPRSSR